MPLLITTQETCAVWKKPCFHWGKTPVITRDRKTILKADKVILPGVGSFGDAMGKLEQYGLVDVIHETVDQGTPFLGICLGLQLLLAAVEECQGLPAWASFRERYLRYRSIPDLRFRIWAGIH